MQRKTASILMNAKSYRWVYDAFVIPLTCSKLQNDEQTQKGKKGERRSSPCNSLGHAPKNLRHLRMKWRLIMLGMPEIQASRCAARNCIDS